MIYVTYENFEADTFIGIRKKIFAQIRVFQKYFSKVYYTCYVGQMMYFCMDDRVLEKEMALTMEECNEWLKVWMKKYAVQRFFIRHQYTDKSFVEFVAFLKKEKIKFVMEIPTYPMENTIVLPEYVTVLEDNFYHGELKKYVDIVAGYGEYEEIFGIPCLKLQNGIDIKEQPLRKRCVEEKKIVLMAVSSMHKVYGYERIILGMKSYYENNGTRDIVFKLIGVGVELNYYKTLVQELGLNDKVFFLGKLYGDDLNREYDSSDIAVGSLALYKMNANTSASIKAGEYCARGIPFINGYKDIRFDGSEDYILKVSNDATVIDMNRIVEFYDYCVKQSDIGLRMREKAKKELTWDVCLQPVIEHLKADRH